MALLNVVESCIRVHKVSLETLKAEIDMISQPICEFSLAVSLKRERFADQAKSAFGELLIIAKTCLN